MKVGEKVEHRSRSDVGIGMLVEISGETCTVEFQGSRFSGISLDAIWSVEERIQKQQKLEIKRLQILEDEKERREAEEKRHKS